MDPIVQNKHFIISTNETSQHRSESSKGNLNSSKTKIFQPKLINNNGKQYDSMYTNSLREALFTHFERPYRAPEVPSTVFQEGDHSYKNVCRQCKDCFHHSSSLEEHISRGSWILGYWCTHCFQECEHLADKNLYCSKCMKLQTHKFEELHSRGLKKNVEPGIVKIFFNPCQLLEHMQIHNSEEISVHQLMLLPFPSGIGKEYFPHLKMISEALMDFMFLTNVHVVDWLFKNRIHKWWRMAKGDNPVANIIKKYPFEIQQIKQLLNCNDKVNQMSKFSADFSNMDSCSNQKVKPITSNILLDVNVSTHILMNNKMALKASVTSSQNSTQTAEDITFVDCGSYNNERNNFNTMTTALNKIQILSNKNIPVSAIPQNTRTISSKAKISVKKFAKVPVSPSISHALLKPNSTLLSKNKYNNITSDDHVVAIRSANSVNLISLIRSFPQIAHKVANKKIMFIRKNLTTDTNSTSLKSLSRDQLQNSSLLKSGKVTNKDQKITRTQKSPQHSLSTTKLETSNTGFTSIQNKSLNKHSVPDSSKFEPKVVKKSTFGINQKYKTSIIKSQTMNSANSTEYLRYNIEQSQKRIISLNSKSRISSTATDLNKTANNEVITCHDENLDSFLRVLNNTSKKVLGKFFQDDELMFLSVAKNEKTGKSFLSVMHDKSNIFTDDNLAYRNKMFSYLNKMNKVKIYQRVSHIKAVSRKYSEKVGILNDSIIEEHKKFISLLEDIAAHSDSLTQSVADDYFGPLLDPISGEMCKTCKKITKPAEYLVGFSNVVDDLDYCLCYDFICFKCNIFQGNQERFYAHLRYHNFESPHMCPECNVSFTSFQNLNVHIWTTCFHPLARRFLSCRICEINGFCSLESIINHFVIMHSIKMAACIFCRMVFEYKRYCISHINKGHADIMNSDEPLQLTICQLDDKVVPIECYNYHMKNHNCLRESIFYNCNLCLRYNKNLEVFESQESIKVHIYTCHYSELSTIIDPESLTEILSMKAIRELIGDKSTLSTLPSVSKINTAITKVPSTKIIYSSTNDSSNNLLLISLPKNNLLLTNEELDDSTISKRNDLNVTYENLDKENDLIKEITNNESSDSIDAYNSRNYSQNVLNEEFNDFCNLESENFLKTNDLHMSLNHESHILTDLGTSSLTLSTESKNLELSYQSNKISLKDQFNNKSSRLEICEINKNDENNTVNGALEGENKKLNNFMQHIKNNLIVSKEKNPFTFSVTGKCNQFNGLEPTGLFLVYNDNTDKLLPEISQTKIENGKLSAATITLQYNDLQLEDKESNNSSVKHVSTEIEKNTASEINDNKFNSMISVVSKNGITNSIKQNSNDVTNNPTLQIQVGHINMSDVKTQNHAVQNRASDNEIKNNLNITSVNILSKHDVEQSNSTVSKNYEENIINDLSLLEKQNLNYILNDVQDKNQILQNINSLSKKDPERNNSIISYVPSQCVEQTLPNIQHKSYILEPNKLQKRTNENIEQSNAASIQTNAEEKKSSQDLGTCKKCRPKYSLINKRNENMKQASKHNKSNCFCLQLDKNIETANVIMSKKIDDSIFNVCQMKNCRDPTEVMLVQIANDNNSITGQGVNNNLVATSTKKQSILHSEENSVFPLLDDEQRTTVTANANNQSLNSEKTKENILNDENIVSKIVEHKERNVSNKEQNLTTIVADSFCVVKTNEPIIQSTTPSDTKINLDYEGAHINKQKNSNKENNTIEKLDNCTYKEKDEPLETKYMASFDQNNKLKIHHNLSNKNILEQLTVEPSSMLNTKPNKIHLNTTVSINTSILSDKKTEETVTRTEENDILDNTKKMKQKTCEKTTYLNERKEQQVIDKVMSLNNDCNVEFELLKEKTILSNPKANNVLDNATNDTNVDHLIIRKEYILINKSDKDQLIVDLNNESKNDKNNIINNDETVKEEIVKKNLATNNERNKEDSIKQINTLLCNDENKKHKIHITLNNEKNVKNLIQVNNISINSKLEKNNDRSSFQHKHQSIDQDLNQVESIGKNILNKEIPRKEITCFNQNIDRSTVKVIRKSDNIAETDKLFDEKNDELEETDYQEQFVLKEKMQLDISNKNRSLSDIAPNNSSGSDENSTYVHCIAKNYSMLNTLCKSNENIETHKNEEVNKEFKDFANLEKVENRPNIIQINKKKNVISPSFDKNLNEVTIVDLRKSYVPTEQVIVKNNDGRIPVAKELSVEKKGNTNDATSTAIADVENAMQSTFDVNVKSNEPVRHDSVCLSPKPETKNKLIIGLNDSRENFIKMETKKPRYNEFAETKKINKNDSCSNDLLLVKNEQKHLPLIEKTFKCGKYKLKNLPLTDNEKLILSKSSVTTSSSNLKSLNNEEIKNENVKRLRTRVVKKLYDSSSQILITRKKRNVKLNQSLNKNDGSMKKPKIKENITAISKRELLKTHKLNILEYDVSKISKLRRLTSKDNYSTKEKEETDTKLCKKSIPTNSKEVMLIKRRLKRKRTYALDDNLDTNIQKIDLKKSVQLQMPRLRLIKTPTRSSPVNFSCCSEKVPNLRVVKKYKIGFDNTTNFTTTICKFKCHLCGDSINTSWPVISAHYNEIHACNYELCTISTRLTRLSDKDLCGADQKKKINKKRKSVEISVVNTKRQKRCSTKKINENFMITTDRKSGLFVQLEPVIDGEGHFKCKKCNERCVHMGDLRQHISDNHRITKKNLICLECGENFVVSPSLQMHLKAFHGIDDPNAYMNQYPAYAPDVVDLEAEAKVTAVNQCHVCMAVFKDKLAVDKHLRVHGMAFLNRKRIEARNAQLCLKQKAENDKDNDTNNSVKDLTTSPELKQNKSFIRPSSEDTSNTISSR